jgi:hypothetical protein
MKEQNSMDIEQSFRNVSALPTEALTILSRAIDQQVLQLALIGVPDIVRSRFQHIMPKPAWRIFLEEMADFGPVSITDVEEAQQDVIAMVSELLDGGYISQTPERQPEYSPEPVVDDEEPSMEEILASIRVILQEEEEAEARAQTRAKIQAQERPCANSHLKRPANSAVQKTDLIAFEDLPQLSASVLRDLIKTVLQDWHILVSAVVLAEEHVFKAFMDVMDEDQAVRLSWELVNASPFTVEEQAEQQRVLCYRASDYLDLHITSIDQLAGLRDAERRTLMQDLDWGRWCLQAALQGTDADTLDVLLSVMSPRDIDAVIKNLPARQFTTTQVEVARAWLCQNIDDSVESSDEWNERK